MGETQYQAKLINTLKEKFPGCVVLKNDANHQQGILDLTILYNDKWAMLEVKHSNTSTLRVNQEYFVHKLDEMSFAAFIYPENEEDVLDALQDAFEPRQRTRVSES